MKTGEGQVIFSVIIPSYNSEKTIDACLDSVIGQRTALPYEVIVADSSDDNTKNVVRNKFPSFNLISFETKTDPGTARNVGIERARGSIIVFTDSDCIVPENWLEEYYRIYSRKKECLAAGGSLVNANTETLSSIAGYFIEFSDYMPSLPSGAVLSLPTSNISFRKEIFDKYGGYKPDMAVRCQEGKRIPAPFLRVSFFVC